MVHQSMREKVISISWIADWRAFKDMKDRERVRSRSFMLNKPSGLKGRWATSPMLVFFTNMIFLLSSPLLVFVTNIIFSGCLLVKNPSN